MKTKEGKVMLTKMTKSEWDNCSQKAAEFANNLFGIRLEKLVHRDIAFLAAYSSYGPSTRDTNAFLGSFITELSLSAKNKKKEDLKLKVVESILVPFFNVKAFDNNTCMETIKKIRKFYRDNGIVHYTFGNAQKWLNLAIKYFIICSACYVFDKCGNYISYDFNTFNKKIKIDMEKCFKDNKYFGLYNLFAVDSIMIGKTCKRNFGVKFCNSPIDATCWSDCDDEMQFTSYWKSVQKVISTDVVDMPLLWELTTWAPRAKKKKTYSKNTYFA